MTAIDLESLVLKRLADTEANTVDALNWNTVCEQRDKAEADRAVLVEVVKWYASGLTWHRVDNMDAGLARKDRGELARAALRSVCETDSQAKVGEFPGSSPSEETP